MIMREVGEMRFPEDLRYSEDHEWTKSEGGQVRVGISDYAQDQLGDVVFVELPEVGAALKKGDVFGSVESVKAVSELYMPLAGEVVEVNAALEDSPDLVNSSPYEEGWMILVKPDDDAALQKLLTKDAYMKVLKESD
jgi:glycine cleavage system H protein